MHSHTLLSFGLAAVLPAGTLAVSGSGHSTRYWDCCKPSCAWSGKASVSHPVTTCDNKNSPLTSYDTASGCNGGDAYMCGDQTPWAVNDDLAYGFAATSISGGEATSCCGCYALTFTSGPVSGKTMVVQSTNTGGDLGSNQFDLAIPGGGLGIFDGCTPQFGGLPGARYGGVSSVSDCKSMPQWLQAGCEWRFNWFENADNPSFTFTQVQCPKELTEKTGCVRDDDSSFPAYAVSGGSSSSSSGKVAASSAVSSSSSSAAAVSTESTSSAQPTTLAQATNSAQSAVSTESTSAEATTPAQSQSAAVSSSASTSTRTPKCRHARHA